MRWGGGRAAGRWWGRSGPLEHGGVLNAHEWAHGPPEKKCVLRDGFRCDASVCGGGEGCHDDFPTLLYTGVCSVGSVVSSFFGVNLPLVPRLWPGTLVELTCGAAARKKYKRVISLWYISLLQ